MKKIPSSEYVRDLRYGYRLLQDAWRMSLHAERPDWARLFAVHYELVRVERQLRRLEPSA